MKKPPDKTPVMENKAVPKMEKIKLIVRVKDQTQPFMMEAKRSMT